jgi:hypothetical protein
MHFNVTECDLSAQSVVVIEEINFVLSKEFQRMHRFSISPYKCLIKWITQEILSLKALSEAFQLMEQIDEKRRRI